MRPATADWSFKSFSVLELAMKETEIELSEIEIEKLGVEGRRNGEQKKEICSYRKWKSDVFRYRGGDVAEMWGW